jgi:hypothetical protein
MIPTRCENCGRPRKWHQLKSGYGYTSEVLYTAPNRRLVCANCFLALTGKQPRSLTEINAECKLSKEKKEEMSRHRVY